MIMQKYLKRAIFFYAAAAAAFIHLLKRKKNKFKKIILYFICELFICVLSTKKGNLFLIYKDNFHKQFLVGCEEKLKFL
jgi:hypothetical protein